VVQTPKVETQVQPIAEKPSVFIPNQHMASSSVKIPSLKDLGKGIPVEAEKEDDPYLKGTDKEDFTYDDFLKYWSDYTAKVKEEGKKNLLSIFTTNAPIMLKPYVFEVIAGTKVQEIAFRDEKPYILNFLRTSLKNFDIEIQTRIDEVIATKKLYSAQDKYQHMASKNPELIELRKRFNLELE
jgi:DNA polymerase-3 subunit gamma/tau